MPALRGLEHRVGHVVRGQTIAETGRCARARAQRLHEIGKLVNEAVLVADLQAGHPPPLHIRMLPVCHVDASPAPHTPFIAVIKKLDPVQIMKIPRRGGVLAVDFQCVQRLVTSRVTRRFECSERAVLESAQKSAGVIDAHRLHAPGQGMLTLFDECLRHCGYFRDRAVEPESGVDGVSQQIAGDAAAGDRQIEAPECLATLGQVGRNRPVLQELGAVVENAAETPLVQEKLEQHDRRHAAVVIPDHVRDPGGIHRGDHRLRLRRVAAERFVAEHDLAGLRRGNGDFGVRIVRAGDVDDIDILSADKGAPVRFHRLISPVLREGMGALGVARADGLEYRPVGQVEKAGRLEECVGMSPPHESAAYQAYIEVRFRHVAHQASVETYQRRMALKLHPEQIMSQAEKLHHTRHRQSRCGGSWAFHA